jgi:hypothetical protein
LADDINVNLNLRNQSTGNVPDTPTLAGNKQLASALERSLKPLLKNIEKSTTESFKSAMKNYARPASTGSGKSSGAAYADFDKALKDGFDGFGQTMSNLFDRLVTQINENTSPKQFEASLRKAVKAQVDVSLRYAVDQASYHNLKVDPKAQQKASEQITNAVVSRYSDSLGSTVTKLAAAVNELRILTEKSIDASNAAARAYKNKDFVGGVTAAKKGIDTIAQARKTQEVFKDLRSVNKELIQKQKDVAAEISAGIQSLRSTVSSRVTKAKKDIASDPVGASKDIAKALSVRLSKIPEVAQNPELSKKVDRLVSKMKSFEDASKAIEKMSDIAKKTWSEKDVSSGDVKELKKAFDELRSVAGQLGSIPKNEQIRSDTPGGKKVIEVLRNFDATADKIFKITDKHVVKGTDTTVSVDKKSIQEIEDGLAKGGKKAADAIDKALSAYDATEIKDVAKEFVTEYQKVIKSAKGQKIDTKFLEAAFKSGSLKGVLNKSMDVPDTGKLRESANILLGMGDRKKIEDAISKVSEKFGSIGEGLDSLEASIGHAADEFKPTSSVSSKTKKVAEGLDELTKSIKGSNKAAKDVAETIKKPTIAAPEPQVKKSDARSMYNRINLQRSLMQPQTTQYKETLVSPDLNVEKALGANMKSKNKYVVEASKNIRDNVTGLAKSLNDLQKDIVGTLEKELPTKKNWNWQIVKKGGADINEYFKAAGGAGESNRKLARYWKLQVANVSGLKSMLGKESDDITSVVDLVNQAKTRLIKNITKTNKDSDSLAGGISEWV